MKAPRWMRRRDRKRCRAAKLTARARLRLGAR